MQMNKKLLLSAVISLAFAPALVSAAPLLGDNLSSFSILSGTDISLGALSQIDGKVGASIAIAGSGASGVPSSGTTNLLGVLVGGETLLPNGTPSALNPSGTAAVVNGLLELQAAKATLSLMTATQSYVLPTVAGTNFTLKNGVYQYTVFNIAADNKIMLDGQNQANPIWVFNVDTALGTGPNLTFEFVNVPGSFASVFWNVGTAANLGAGTQFIGTILAGAAINEAAGVSIPCGNAYSLAAVGTSAGSKVQSSNCLGSATWAAKTGGGLDSTGVAVSPVPEPETYALMLGGLGMLSLKLRRNKKNQQA